MKRDAFRQAIRTLLGSSFRRQGLYPPAPFLSYGYTIVSDLLYIVFGRRPPSSDRDDVLCHVINSLAARRRVPMIRVVEQRQIVDQRAKLEEIASLMGISVSRTLRLVNSATESARRRCLWHGVKLHSTGPAPAVLMSEVNAGRIDVEILKADIESPASAAQTKRIV